MSRRSRAGLLALCILLCTLLVWLDRSCSELTWRGQLKSNKPTKAGDIEKYHKKTFTIVNVVDGDTVDIDVEDGEYEHTRIRLWGVDTPETKHPQTGVMHFGPEAADFTTKLALSKEVTVYLDTENQTRGYYGRLLAYVRLSDSAFLNELLLTEGFAYADLRFDHSLYNKYKQLEAGARSQKKGLWKEVTSDQLPEWRRKF
ncbi:MAG: thermonuclease family protein [Planctomycetota bacterium]